MEYQYHFGRQFYQDKKTGYWISSDFPRIRAHRWVWKNHFGDIPKGCHIHHKDENKSNNTIQNLELMVASEHLSRHSSIPEKKQLMKQWAEKIRPLTKVWHASPEGRAWHKYHAIKSKFGNWEPKSYKCEQCDKEFTSKKIRNTRFCSNNCKSKWRRDQGLDNIESKCEICGGVFIKNKYSKKITCGRRCGTRIRWQRNKAD